MLFELFAFEFMQRAFIAGIFLAPLLAVLGSFVTLRKMSFFADGIAHASLFGVALALIGQTLPFVGALFIAVLFAVVVFYLERNTRIASDALIGVMFTTGLALGVVIIALQPGYQPELISFLFGNILTVTWENVYIISAFSVATLLFVYAYFRQLVLLALSEELAKVSGVKTYVLDLAFYIAIAVAVVLGVKLLGIVLVTALLVTPAVSARLLAHSFVRYCTAAVVVALIAFVVGLTVSYYFDLPSGATIVLVASALFALLLTVQKLRT